MGKGLEGCHLGYVTQLIYINFLSNYAIFVVHAYSMQHTKFQGRRSIASGEEIFYAFIIYDMGVAAMLIICRRTFEQLFVHKGPKGCI